MTDSLNQWFADNHTARNSLLIFCSMLMDIMTIMSLYKFAKYTNSWRFVIASASFYGLRSLTTTFFNMEMPAGYLWDYPGFPSLTVPYGKTSDFFYSGHVGACVIQFLEFRSGGWKYWSMFALFSMIAQMFLMVVLRSHYSIDLLAAVIFGHYFWIQAEKYSYLIDWCIFGIPLSKRIDQNLESMSNVPCTENGTTLGELKN